MDFFASQDAARRKTSVLVFCFGAAVVMMITAFYFAALAAFSFTGGRRTGKPVDLWQPELLLIVGLITIAIIALGSLYKIIELRAGGERIATNLGGQRIQPNTTDLAERRLLNVVEEMAVASGVAVPPVFVLNGEKSINAFAAGFTPGDAVIGVNRGTLQCLSRDELQGVIAHEFSHILNGDMRLNLRLIGILHGILLIALIGYYMLRIGGASGRSSRRGGKGAGQLVFIGIAAIIIGYIGLFFTRLIKAAVSRQREYLSDASAVQFTRNPDGIGGALKKIGALAAGSRMDTPEAETTSHMFFGNAFQPSMFSFLATHPPLVDRIRRIDPQFDGRFPQTVRPPAFARGEAPEERKRPQPADFPLRGRWGLGKAGERIPLDPVLLMAAIGAPSTGHVEYAAQVVAAMPEVLTNAVRDPFSARAVAFAMLLDTEAELRDKQLHLMEVREGEPTRREVVKLAPLVAEQGEAARLPMIEMLQRALSEISPAQYERFRESVIELVKADERITLFEFVLQRVLLVNLDRRFRGAKPPSVRYFSWNAVSPEMATLISALAHVGSRDVNEAKRAFEKATSGFSSAEGLTFQPRDDCTLTNIHEALKKLAEASPVVKKRLLGALVVCVATDGWVTVTEAELLRAVADSLDCPIPPILAGSVGEHETVDPESRRV